MRLKALATAATAILIGLSAIAAPAARAQVRPAVNWPWLGTQALWNVHSQRCLGIAADGNAGIWNCTYTGDQEWTVGSALGPGYHLMVNNKNQCLYATGGQGSQVKAGLCNLTTSMGWMYYTDSYGRAVFKNESTSQILAVYGALTANGSKVVTWADTNGADQAWLLS